jgi:hypothetical protein
VSIGFGGGSINSLVDLCVFNKTLELDYICLATASCSFDLSSGNVNNLE